MLEIIQATDLRLVRLYWKEGGSSLEHIVAVQELNRFVQASLALNHKPGRNPHINGKTAQVGAITVTLLRPYGPYWWTTPDLQNNEDPKGARTYDWDVVEEEVWRLPGFDLDAAKEARINSKAQAEFVVAA